jgi:hypothetical protein
VKRELTGRQLAKLIEQQLGRRPKIDFSIAVLCGYGWPAVTRNKPFAEDGSPNPNRFYLTCPYLRREIAVLEDRGMIKKLEAEINEDDSLISQLRGAQGEHRAGWLQDAGRDWPGPKGEAPRIAASSEDLLIKCLHAHAAWYLVNTRYQPGRIILDAVGETWCKDELCERFDISDTGPGNLLSDNSGE